MLLVTAYLQDGYSHTLFSPDAGATWKDLTELHHKFL